MRRLHGAAWRIEQARSLAGGREGGREGGGKHWSAIIMPAMNDHVRRFRT